MDTCTTTKGEKRRLAFIDTPESRGPKAEPVPAKASRDYLNTLVEEQEVSIRRITKDRYGRTVAELSKGRMNIQKRLVGKGYAKIYQRYADQCKWYKEENILGAYSYPSPGSTPLDYKVLSTPVDGKLFFCGEHTNFDYSATTYGAYLSGIRVVKDIEKAILN